MEQLDYKVDIEVFEGPFDLLLELILKQEVDIYEVPIAKITDDYLRQITKMKEMNLDLTSEFLVIAATLLELKSYALLPVDEEDEIEAIRSEMETRESLIEHLVDYMTFQGVTKAMLSLAEEQSYLFPRIAQPEEGLGDLTPDFLEGIRLTDLSSLAQELLQIKPSFVVDTAHMAIYKVSISKKAKEVVDLLRVTKTGSFRELCDGADSKIEKIVIFLAILELFKRGIIGITQARVFGDIKVKLVNEEILSRDQWEEA